MNRYIQNNRMNYRWLLTILYGLYVIWTGLLRTIQAGEFKPNAFWFCLVTGLIAIVAGFLYRADKNWAATIVASLAVTVVLLFYLNCFITQPDKDATYRVGLVIIASIAQLCVITLPKRVAPPPN
ncbi:MAG: hypothetical protein HKN47_05385 [Pirellulaceae bacterium]|nr:hypothetical protein [Pirellulaceae bacterium]